MKDWIGNKHTTWSTLGASNHANHDRAEHDYYATDPRAIDALFGVEPFSENVWEVACGEGHLSKRMIELGKNVTSTDLIYRGFGLGNRDFFLEKDWLGDIITNPPYKYALEFVQHAIRLQQQSLNGKIAMFLKLTFLEGQRRYSKLFAHTPPPVGFGYFLVVLSVQSMVILPKRDQVLLVMLGLCGRKVGVKGLL